MRAAKSPGAVAALGASEGDELIRHVGSKLSFQKIFTQAPIYTTLVGSDWRDIADSTAKLSLARGFAIEKVIEQRGIKLRGKIERVGPCPICGGTDRFSINIRKQVFNCRGCRVGGDLIKLIMFLDSCTFSKACATLTGETLSRSTGKPQHKPKSEQRLENQDYEREQRAKARYLYKSSQAAQETLVEDYLRLRGMTPPLPKMVRFLPPFKHGHHPAMLIPYGLPDEPEPGALHVATTAIAAVQLTLLRADGRGKAEAKPNKITIASPAGMPMVLAPVNDLLGLAICEGVEDAMSVHRVTGLGTWASGGAPFMSKLACTVPDYIEAVTIFAHDDGAGQRGARDLADALIARNIEVFVEGVAL